jgi:hypothetical protein
MVTNHFTTTGGRFIVKSLGNGWAYEIEERHTSFTLWFQDADAESVRELTNNFEDERAVVYLFDAFTIDA